MENNVRIKLEGDREDPRREGVYAMVVSLQLQTVELPDQYNQAIHEKQSAEEDITLAQNERNKRLPRLRPSSFEPRKKPAR